MSRSMLQTARRPGFGQMLLGGALAALAIAGVIWPGMALFVGRSLVVIAPLVIPGIALAAWIVASGADTHIAQVFNRRIGQAVVAATAIGAVTPVCGVTVLPLMVGLLAAGVPLAPVMAFWLSSPVTDPAMLAATAATLGVSFALAKTAAALLLGLIGGFGVAMFGSRDWVHQPLRQNGLVLGLLDGRDGCGDNCAAPLPFRWNIWADPDRSRRFRARALATTRLMLICLIPAFAAEYALNASLRPEALSGWVGRDTPWAIPLAVMVGAPAYLDGFAALPLTRGLINLGMSPGAALGFLVSGGVISIWGAMALFPVLRLKPFLLYLALALAGSLLAAYGFEAVMA